MLSTLLLPTCAVVYAAEVAQPATSVVQQSVESDVERGRTLAARWCGNCHLAPEPGDLPRERWPYVIKWMGNYLGHPNLDDDVKKLIYPTLVATKPFITAEEL